MEPLTALKVPAMDGTLPLKHAGHVPDGCTGISSVAENALPNEAIHTVFHLNQAGEVDAHAFKTAALRIPGIGDIGIVPTRPVPEALNLYWQQYLAQGKQASMRYLERNQDKRADPGLLLPGSQSLVVILCPYRPPQGTRLHPRIALYAQGEDYHKVVKDKLFQLAKMLPSLPFRAFCDTAPLLEKFWASQAGLGWIGRNTLLIHPRFGSFCFIGILLTANRFDQYDTPLPESGLRLDKGSRLAPKESSSPTPALPDAEKARLKNEAMNLSRHEELQKLSPHPCSDCLKCVQACPGQALEPGQGLDARRCFSFLTIENQGERPPIPTPYWFGCDICQSVCPANHIPWGETPSQKESPNANPAPSTSETRLSPSTSNEASNPAPSPFDPAFLPLPGLKELHPACLAAMDEAGFQKRFRHSPLCRAGRDGLLKNMEAWQAGHAQQVERQG